MNTHPSTVTGLLLSALQWRGVGTTTVREVARMVSPPTNIEALRAAFVRRFPRLTLPTAAEEERASERARVILDKCHELGISAVSLWDSQYPRRLAAIEDAPPILYVLGNVAALSLPCIAVVGTREASESGLRAAHLTARRLVERGYCVVSGLALGIDAAAHEGAIAVQGKTMAVLAHGLHMVAPTTNRPVADALLRLGGALVSEHAPGVPPRPAEFVRRNRIQSGLSICSIVVESGETGGAIHQATFTRDQGRSVLVVCPKDEAQHPNFKYAGARRLMETHGAHPISGTGALDAELLRLSAESGGGPTGPEPELAQMDFSYAGAPV